MSCVVSHQWWVVVVFMLHHVPDSIALLQIRSFPSKASAFSAVVTHSRRISLDASVYPSSRSLSQHPLPCRLQSLAVVVGSLEYGLLQEHQLGTGRRPQPLALLHFPLPVVSATLLAAQG